MKPVSMPRVLLVEDDPVSRAFLSAAVRGVPAEVDGADTLAAAVALAGAQPYDLWLFDAQLPDGHGGDLLARLRASHPGVPALAHTASTERATLDALIAAGFAEVLVKPLPAIAVQSAVRRVLGLTAGAPATTVDAINVEGGKLPIWDDDAAARALNFNRTHITTLRSLFVAELPQARQRTLAAAGAGDHESLRADLHKLRASCGFVGAARLGAVVQAWQQQPDSALLFARFDEVVQDTLLQGDVSPDDAHPGHPIETPG